MDKALEISDLSGKELNTLSAYKRAVWDKRDISNKLLHNIVDDNGGLTGFIKFLKDNQTKIQNYDADLDRLAKQFGDLVNNRKNTYASYKEFAQE